jgi:hypothetical protein
MENEQSTTIRLDPSAPPLPPKPREAEPPAPPVSHLSEPVQALLGEAEDYYTLEEIATVIVEDAVVRSMADAGVLLVPDGALWRVAAGVGLRPLEYRLQLTDESWVVENIATAGKGILVEDSDVARQNLRGAPLASRPYLMAVPVPQVHAILLLARDRSEPFTEQSLGALVGLADEAGPLLQRALDLRKLARMLYRHVDIEQPGA